MIASVRFEGKSSATALPEEGSVLEQNMRDSLTHEPTSSIQQNTIILHHKMSKVIGHTATRAKTKVNRRKGFKHKFDGCLLWPITNELSNSRRS